MCPPKIKQVWGIVVCEEPGGSHVRESFTAPHHKCSPSFKNEDENGNYFL